MLDGHRGPARQEALRHQIAVGRVFDAEDFVEVAHVHLMADTESLGESGVAWLESIARLPEDGAPGAGADGHRSARDRLLRVPEAQAGGTDGRPRAARDRRVRVDGHPDDRHLHQLPVGAAPGAGRASRVRRHRVHHLREQRPRCAEQLRGRAGCPLRRPHRPRAPLRVPPRPSTDAAPISSKSGTAPGHGATGAHSEGSSGGGPETTGRFRSSSGIEGAPTSDDLKHFGAALASYGSVPMFHLVGVTPEAPDLAGALDGAPPDPIPVGREEIDAFYASFGRHEDRVDVVVFAAPQLSLVELQAVARALEGKRVHSRTALLVATSPEIKAAADRMGITATIEAAGARAPSRGVLLPDVRPRARGGERLDEPPHQLREARQHHLGLRLPPGARDHRGVHRGGGAGEDVTVARPAPDDSRPSRHRPAR